MGAGAATKTRLTLAIALLFVVSACSPDGPKATPTLDLDPTVSTTSGLVTTTTQDLSFEADYWAMLAEQRVEGLIERENLVGPSDVGCEVQWSGTVYLVGPVTEEKVVVVEDQLKTVTLSAVDGGLVELHVLDQYGEFWSHVDSTKLVPFHDGIQFTTPSDEHPLGVRLRCWVGTASA